MDKKAISPIAVIGIIFLILIVFGIVIVLILSQRGYFHHESSTTNQTMIRLILQVGDEAVKDSSIGANYRIRTTNGTLISEGFIESGESREILVYPETIEVACWNNDYYLTKAYRVFTPTEIQYKIATFSCDMPKIEKNLRVEYIGSFNGRTLTHYLNLTSENDFQRPIICIGYSSGFNDVSIEDSFINCDSGVWINYTFYNATTRTYNYLPLGEYVCGSDRIEKCEIVLGSKCRPPSQDIPYKYISYVDNCYYYGDDINKESISIPVKVIVGDYVSRFDNIQIYIMDQDRRWSPEENRYAWFSENNGQDLGAEDVHITIPYL
jgi:hypothetical protein